MQIVDYDKEKGWHYRPVKERQMNGEWKEVIGGYFTPGGDPAWICPFCGGSEHVYGIENIDYPKDRCCECGATLVYPARNK